MSFKYIVFYVFKLQSKFKNEKKKVCSRSFNIYTTKIKIMFLPKNMTSRLQLLDPGIIKNFKVKYKRKLMRCLLARITGDQNAYEIANKIDIIQAIEWITST